MQAMLEAVRDGASHEELAEVEVVLRPALSATASDLLAADGVVLGTPANIGYMSGALKHFFDTVYYPTLDAGAGTPVTAAIYQLDGLVRRAPSLQLTADGQAAMRHVTPLREEVTA